MQYKSKKIKNIYFSDIKSGDTTMTSDLYKIFSACKSVEEFTALKEEIKETFQREEYGFFPEKPLAVSGEVVSSEETMAGKSILEKINLTINLREGQYTFPFWYCYPKRKKNKTIILLNFRDCFPDKYLPAEEVIDDGWAVADMCYNDVTSDDNDFTNGFAALFDREKEGSAGKIVLWAYAAMRIADYLGTREETDMENLAVVGHSRLGKTAIVTAAFDERFKFCHSNCSGTCGAAAFFMRTKESEPISVISSVFPHWFSKGFSKYSDKEKEMPFEQYMLMSLIAPRVLSVGSAVEDLWANPPAEMCSAAKASEIWKLYGEQPLKEETDPEIGKIYGDKVTYYVRERKHYLSRDDWRRILEIFDRRI